MTTVGKLIKKNSLTGKQGYGSGPPESRTSSQYAQIGNKLVITPYMSWRKNTVYTVRLVSVWELHTMPSATLWELGNMHPIALWELRAIHHGCIMGILHRTHEDSVGTVTPSDWLRYVHSYRRMPGATVKGYHTPRYLWQ